jgi:hypothetical protein
MLNFIFLMLYFTFLIFSYYTSSTLLLFFQMGLKIKAGMAIGGLVLSWAFGLNFLSGIASYADSTGNILVDIADGIGLISKVS